MLVSVCELSLCEYYSNWLFGVKHARGNFRTGAEITTPVNEDLFVKWREIISQTHT